MAVQANAFEYTPHQQVVERKPPVKTRQLRGESLNARIGLRITLIVGTMVCAYVFAALAFVSLPQAIKALSRGDTLSAVAWLSQTFFQLVLLPIIIVGQNIQGKAADIRSEQTYKDAEAILHECQQLQAHLQSQDGLLSNIVARVRAIESPAK